MYKLLPILLFAYGLALTTEDIYDNSYALIIGISKYDGLNPNQSYLNLNYAASDAEAIQNLLISQFDFPAKNTILLKNEEATKQNILQSFSDIIKKAKSKDRVLIYFAMQGMTEDLPNGGELGYLIPIDGELDDLYMTSLGMTELKNIAKKTTSFDNNNDGIIDELISDNDYSNLGFDDWLLIFNGFGPNNIFIYTVEIPIRPFDGSALTDSDGNVVPGFEATDCGRTGDVFFMFQTTDRSNLTDSIENIHIEIIEP